MKLELLKTSLDGVYELLSEVYKDDRGNFIKTFHHDIFQENGLANDFKEQYFSLSRKNVLRGMHFQTPPFDHEKLVYCVKGDVIDVVVDLRKNSSTFGKYEAFNLSGSKGNMVYIPKGFAHGFYVTSDEAIMVYNVSTVYSQFNDSGIKWNSFGFKWPSEEPIVSKRDDSFQNIANFDSPFY